MDPNLERARDELEAATDGASRGVQTKLRSIDAGIFEEEGGDRTQAEPGPKADRIAELYETLDDLADEADGATAERIGRARDAVRAYTGEHPQGGD